MLYSNNYSPIFYSNLDQNPINMSPILAQVLGFALAESVKIFQSQRISIKTTPTSKECSSKNFQFASQLFEKKNYDFQLKPNSDLSQLDGIKNENKQQSFFIINSFQKKQEKSSNAQSNDCKKNKKIRKSSKKIKNTSQQIKIEKPQNKNIFEVGKQMKLIQCYDGTALAKIPKTGILKTPQILRKKLRLMKHNVLNWDSVGKKNRREK